MNLPTEEQIKHLQSLLDAGTPGEWTTEGVVVWTDEGLEIGSMDRDARLVCNLHNLAPALLEAARENLRLREAMKLILKKVVGTQALIENEATEEALSTVEFCLQDISTIISHPHLVRELNQKESV